MDRKSLIVLLISFVLLALWYPLVNRLFPPAPLPEPPAVVEPGIPPTAGDPAQPRVPDSISPASDTPAFVRPGAAEETLTIEDENARYTFTSHGGGLKLVELKGYAATVDCSRSGRGESDPANLASLNTRAPVPALSVLGGEHLEGDGLYRLSRISNGVRSEKSLPNGLRIVKDFLIGTNYLLRSNVRLENTSTQPLALPSQEWVVGTATPIGRRDETMMMGMQWYNGEGEESVGEPWFANRTLGCLPGQPRSQYVAGASNVVWAAVHNQFFTMVATPSDPAFQVVGRRVALPPATQAEIAADPRTVAQPYGYQAAFLYPPSVIAPNEVITRQFDVYAGPKEYNTLARLGNNVDLVMKFGFFGFFAKALLLSMNGLHAVGFSYGWAIVGITVIIKIIFWPLTTASTRSMKRMQALQPQMKALQEKYKEDPKKMNAKLIEFMRENKVSPLGGCLPLLLQIPVFIGFYTMLQSAIELRGVPFLWICDLSQPDTVAFLPGLGFPINLMPLLMGATMIWQAQLMPVSPGMDPTQQKIMKYMPLMFMVFLYNFSAGLTLYWTVQNLLTIAQMKLTKTHVPVLPTPGGRPGNPPPSASPKGSRPKNKH